MRSVLSLFLCLLLVALPLTACTEGNGQTTTTADTFASLSNSLSVSQSTGAAFSASARCASSTGATTINA